MQAQSNIPHSPTHPLLFAVQLNAKRLNYIMVPCAISGLAPRRPLSKQG